MGSYELNTLVYEAAWTIALFAWVIFVVYPLTFFTYKLMTSRGISHNRAIYFNRKIIHMLAGGLVSLAVPLVGYRTPYTIMPMVAILALATYLPHKRGRLLYWFQDPENMNEVNFVIMWGAVMFLSWYLFSGDWRYGVLPVAFMSFGDGVTGIVRNILYAHRNKSWWGNIAMAAICIPAGYALFGLAGGVAGAIASVVEHFEIHKRIDDNVLISSVSFVALIALRSLGL